LVGTIDRAFFYKEGFWGLWTLNYYSEDRSSWWLL